jgi:hypothetical protein
VAVLFIGIFLITNSYAGVSRSATLIIAYLMRIFNWFFEDALKFVQQRRHFANPNPGFRKKLLLYEINLNLRDPYYYDKLIENEKKKKQLQNQKKEKTKKAKQKNK